MAYTDERLQLLMERCGPAVWRLARVLTSTEDAAEDLFHAAFLRLVQNAPEEEPRTWLLRAAYGRAAEQRALGRNPVKALCRRAAIHLCNGEGLTEAEAAHLLGVPLPILRLWLRLAHKKEEPAQYRARFGQGVPAPELEQETLELIAEARSHHSDPPQTEKSSRRAAIIASCVSAAVVLLIAAAVCVVVLHRGRVYDDAPGDFSINTPEPPSVDNTPKDEQTPAPKPEVVDPYAPEEINTEEQHTYASIAAFLAALDDKSAPGYGQHYYNARNLILVPARLPDRAVFRCLYLYSQTGQYEYSYRVAYEGEQYLITVVSKITPPGTAIAVQDHQAAIQTEEVTFTDEGNQRTYVFGEHDRATVTVTRLIANTEEEEPDTPEEEPTEPAEPEPDLSVPDAEVAAALLKQFALERCTLTNELIQMTYQ